MTGLEQEIWPKKRIWQERTGVVYENQLIVVKATPPTLLDKKIRKTKIINLRAVTHEYNGFK